MGIEIERLRVACEMTVRLTELKLRAVPQLFIENFAPELFGKLMREIVQAPEALLMRARECAEWHAQDGDECGTHARAVIADIDAVLGSSAVSDESGREAATSAAGLGTILAAENWPDVLDAACETMEMAGMHDESSYKELKRLHGEMARLMTPNNG